MFIRPELEALAARRGWCSRARVALPQSKPRRATHRMPSPAIFHLKFLVEYYYNSYSFVYIFLKAVLRRAPEAGGRARLKVLPTIRGPKQYRKCIEYIIHHLGHYLSGSRLFRRRRRRILLQEGWISTENQDFAEKRGS